VEVGVGVNVGGDVSIGAGAGAGAGADADADAGAVVDSEFVDVVVLGAAGFEVVAEAVLGALPVVDGEAGGSVVDVPLMYRFTFASISASLSALGSCIQKNSSWFVAGNSST